MSTQIAAIVLGELALLGLVIWVVAGRMQERARWRMDLQTRLLERFSSPGELQQFLESEAGRRFVGSLSPRSSIGPRMLLAIQAGGVLTILGSGLQITGTPDLLDPGIALVALGLGLVASALVTWILARMWGLLPEKVRRDS
jgi:hypothetical protein